MAAQVSARLRSSDEFHDELPRGAEGEARSLGVANGQLDRVLAELAEAQHGVVGRYQLLAAGVGRRAIGARLERSALHQVHRGVYAVGHSVLSVQARWMAATLAYGAGTILSHRSAGELWGIVRRADRPIEVTRSTHVRRRARVVVHQSVLPEDELTIVDGIPVTTVPRTILDLAALAPRRQVERALTEAEVQRLTDRLSIPDLLARYPRRRGTAVLRELLDEDAGSGGVTENDFEELFVRLLDSHGFPRPKFNADVAVADRFFCVDCLWRRERLIVELDGRAAHGTRRAFESDRERDRLLISDGWRVMRVTWRQLRDRSAAIAADLHRTLSGPPSR
jgi:very-short-patch-repair endonuclease